ncbi:hypothetical protein SB749_14860 [Brevibacterium sp. SIMBA_078]|uniref:hypothetical protein n=1 Tax=Brevibacterium sp. SIMBA_078 TaxID=3085816 RepID=UPI0039794B7B
MTRIAPIRYYQGRVAYPSQEQMRRVRAQCDFIENDDGGRPTEDRDCAHAQRIIARGSSSQIRQIDEQAQQKFFDYIGYKHGFRVLTHEQSSDSYRGEVTITHEIVYVIESQPTKGYVKLTLKSEVPQVPNDGFGGIFSGEEVNEIRRMFDRK